MTTDRNTQPTDEAALEPFFAAARNESEAPLDAALARRLSDQALAAMPAAAARAPAAAARAPVPLRPTRRQRRRASAMLAGWLDRLAGLPGVAGATAVAGLTGLAIGLWAPGLEQVTGGALEALGQAGLPLAEPGLPWAEDAGLLALIDG